MTVQPDATDEPIEVRRNAGLLMLVAFGSLAMAAAYGWRASQGSATILWVVVAALVMIGVLHLVAWFDARAPLLVADVHGVRLRAGREWQGLTWSSIARVELEPKRGFLRDGRIVVVPEEDGDDLSLPIGLATAARAEEVVRRLTGLARDRTTVSVRVSPGTEDTAERHTFASVGDDELAPGWVPAAEPDEPAAGPGDRDDPEPETDHPTGPVSAPGPAGTPNRDLGPEWADIPARPGPVAPAIHGSGRAVRADVTRSGVSSVGMLALKRQVDELPEAHELRGTDGRVGLVIEAAPVLDDPAEEEATVAVPEAEEPEWSEPVSDPLIGPTLQEARERLHLSVDSLAERTRIRPHVIESIETDDFAPCGGDFYARGHLRSLARVLGVEADDLIRTYDAAYAQAPIEARRVFEAELATGPRPSIRLTTGGPNWAALIGVVLVLAIIWGAAQYFTGGNDEAGGGTPVVENQVPAASTGDAKGDLAAFGAPTHNRLALSGRGAGSHAVVRTSDGSLVWRGTLAKGQNKRLDVPGKATVAVTRGPGVEAKVNGEKPRLIGGRSASKAVLGKK
ncbi:MAG: helix-turn-helix domain-containing protein [Nocardioidaceae bacterium]